MWWEVNRTLVRSFAGNATHEEVVANYKLPHLGFWYAHSERIGDWLRDHTTPDDFVAVRGFQPEIYAIARRRYPGRFFWTTFLVSPDRAYRRAEWLEEDRLALANHPPKYVVALSGSQDGPDSVKWFLPLGYVPSVVMGEFTILAHGPP